MERVFIYLSALGWFFGGISFIMIIPAAIFFSKRQYPIAVLFLGAFSGYFFTYIYVSYLHKKELINPTLTGNEKWYYTLDYVILASIVLATLFYLLARLFARKDFKKGILVLICFGIFLIGFDKLNQIRFITPLIKENNFAIVQNELNRYGLQIDEEEDIMYGAKDEVSFYIKGYSPSGRTSFLFKIKNNTVVDRYKIERKYRDYLHYEEEKIQGTTLVEIYKTIN